MIMLNMDDYFTKLNHFISKLEILLKKCSKKYQDKREIDQLHNDLTVNTFNFLKSFSNFLKTAILKEFLMHENLSDSQLNENFNHIENELRKTDNYNESSRRKLNENKEKIRFLNTELKSIKALLEKSSNSWIKYKDSYDLLYKWLSDQEKISDLSKTDLANYQRNHRLHAQFNESANFILITSDTVTSAKVKDKLLYLNKCWKAYQDRFKDTQYDQLVKYYECELSLNMIKDRLNKIQVLTQKQCKCNINSVARYQEELQKAYNDVECLDANSKLLDKLIARLNLTDDPSIDINKIKEDLRSSESKINYFRQTLPDFLKNLTKTCTQIASIEEGLHQIEYWIIEGENCLKSEPDQLNYEQIVKQIENQKKHFNDFNYHENSISNKTQSLQSLKALATFNFDYSDLSLKLSKVKELLQSLNIKRHKWEEQFNVHQLSWKIFLQKTKLLEEWISNAQLIVSEKNDDYTYLIHKHKTFFEINADIILNDFLKSGDNLLQLKDDLDKKEVKNLMETFEGQWKMIVTHAPVRLLKLQFKQLEILLRQEIKAADLEISEECQALNENKEDINEILKRHEAKFKHSNFFTTCESYLQGLRMCSKELGEKRVEDNASIEDILSYLQNYWINLTKKIETMNAKLTILPGAKENFERNFFQFASWLNELELNSNSLSNNNLSSISEYRRLLDKTKASLNEFSIKQEQYNIILTQFDYLSTQNILNDEIQIQIDTLKFRFINILNQVEKIEQRTVYLETVISLVVKSDVLANKIRNLSAISARRFMTEEDDRTLQSAINDQKSVIDEIKFIDSEIETIKQDALDCSKNDFSSMPLVMHEKINNTQETIKQSLNEELERRSSLLEIKKSSELRQNKIDSLYRNLDLIQKILDKKTPMQTDDLLNSSFNSLEENLVYDNININHAEYTIYLNCLTTCKRLIQRSKQLINDFKLPITENTSSNSESPVFFNASLNRGSPTPSYHEYHELREIELRLDSLSHQIDLQTDVFETNLAKHAKLKKKFEKLDILLNDLVEKFHVYDLSFLNNPSKNNNETNEILELKYDQLKLDLDQINQLKKELNLFVLEKADLIKTNTINLNKSRTGSLNEGFNEAIYETDLKNDHEINEILERKSIQLEQLEQKCIAKLNDTKMHIDEFNENKNLIQLDLFRNKLDLALENFFYAKDFEEEEQQILLQQKQDAQIDALVPTKEIDEDNLLIETEDILLDQFDLDKVDQCEIELNGYNDEQPENKSEFNIYFNKTTELDIEKDYTEEAPIESRSLNVSITTHIENETQNEVQHTSLLNQENKIEEADEEEQVESNSISINYEVTSNEITTHSSNKADSADTNKEVEILIQVENVKDDANSILEVERFERIIQPPPQALASVTLVTLETEESEQCDRKRNEEETTYGCSRIPSDEIFPTEEEEEQNTNSNPNDTILIDSIEEIVEANQDDDIITKENEPIIDGHLVNLLTRSSEFKNTMNGDTGELSSKNDLIIENEINQIEELNRLNSVKIYATESGIIDTTVETFNENSIQRLDLEKHDPNVSKSTNESKFHDESIHQIKLNESNHLREILNNLKIEENESIEQIRLKQAELKKIELDNLKRENYLRRKELNDLEVERSRILEKNIAIENKLKETFDRFGELKEKINNLNEITLEYCGEKNELNTLFSTYEFELESLNNEIANILLDIEGFGQHKVDPSSLTQFDLIQSFSTYLTSQLDQKKSNFKSILEKKAKLSEYEQNLTKYFDLALKLINDKQHTYVQNITDLEQRIESIKSVEDSMHKCLQQINDLSLSCSSMNLKNNQIEIETNILKPLTILYGNLQKYLHEWKQFNSEFSYFKRFLKHEFRIDVLIYEKENKENKINHTTLEVDFKKYTLLKEKFNAKLKQNDDLLLRGSQLFNNNLNVQVPDACKDFNDTCESINQISKYLDEKLSLLNYAIKEKEKLKSIENNLNKLKQEIDYINLSKTNDLNENKQRLKRLADFKREIKLLIEEKENLSEAFNQTFYLEMKQNLDNLAQHLSDKAFSLEEEIQQEIIKSLPSRLALNDLIDWLKIKIDLVESFSKRIGTDEYKSFNQLETYKKNLIEICQEIASSKENCLSFIKEAIDNEIKQGFYDFTMSEHLAKTEREWSQLKQKINNDIERLNLSLIRISEFDKNVIQMQEWIQQQTVTEMKNLTSIDDDRKILTQINDYKDLLTRLESIWQQERDDIIQNENSSISLIVQNHMSKNLDELKSNLQRMELISKLKIESNLSHVKKVYNQETSEFNSALESEINFVYSGKIISYQQLESAMKKINDILIKLDEKRLKLKTILNKFELDLIETGHLNDIRQASLEINHLEERGRDLIVLLEKEILPVWQKYEEAFKLLQAKLAETNQNTLNDLENIEKIILNPNTNQVFQQRLREMIECKKLNALFDHYSTCLIEKLCQNENTIKQLTVNKSNLKNLFDKMSDLADQFKKSFDEAFTQHQIYSNLLNEISEQIQLANRLIQNFTSVQSITMRANCSDSNSNFLKKFAEDFEKCETNIVNILNKFKSLNIKDIDRIEKIRNASSPCSNILEQMRKYKLSALEFIQERNHLVETKLHEIEKYLAMLQNRRNEEAKLEIDENQNQKTLSSKSLNKLIACIKHLISSNVELNKHAQFLDEQNQSNEKYMERIKVNKESIKKFRRQIEILTQPNGIYEYLIRLNALNDQLNKDLSNNNLDQNLDSLKKYFEKFLSIRIELERQLISLQEKCLNFIDFRTFKMNLLDPIENFYDRQVNDIEQVNKTYKRFKQLVMQVNKNLDDIEEKINISRSELHLNRIIEKNQLEKTGEFENIEAKLSYYRVIKTYLNGAQMKTDIDIIQQLGDQLQQKGFKNSSDGLIGGKSLINHEAIRIKYLDITCRVNKELEKLEVEFSSWKSLLNKSKILLDLIKYLHNQLANITMKTISNEDDTLLYFDYKNSTTTPNVEDANDLLNEVLVANSNLNTKLEMSNTKSLNQLIDFLKLDLQAKLKENEPIKEDVIELSKFAALIKSFDLEFVNNILHEWNLVNDKVQTKLVKLEKFKKSLAELDTKLNKVRELLNEWEIQIDQESLSSLDLTDFQLILNKKSELEKIFDQWDKKDPEIQTIFRSCLNMNKSSLNNNRQNQIIIFSIKNRWQNMRLLIKEKIFLIQNIWLLYCDLNDQIDNFCLVIEKTDQFYRNTLLTANNNPNMFLKLIQELYFTIQDDFKLVKYLNESYVNFSKLASYFSMYQLLNIFKEKFHRINTEWDTLHNEIAVKIKMTRNEETKSQLFSTKDNLITWISEINLLITNLEYLSIKELRIKQADVLELKKEVCDQTEILFKNDALLKEEPDLIENMKEMMKRIIKLDSYLQHSSSPSNLFDKTSPSSDISNSKAKTYCFPKIQSALTISPVNQSTKFLLKSKANQFN